jgi:hypothetical protein
VERSITHGTPEAGSENPDPTPRKTTPRGARWATDRGRETAGKRPEELRGPEPAAPTPPVARRSSARPPAPPDEPGATEPAPSEPWLPFELTPTRIGIGIALLCLAVYYFVAPDRSNLYVHFILQAQAWLSGQTAIPMPGYQDVQPILDASGNETGMGIIPFPPLPALVLLPFVALFHAATNQQLLATIGGAIDVAIAYWMLGFLPLGRHIRALAALFLGLGTVLWYASSIGSTWFFAHVVAVGALTTAVGLALSVDRDATVPQPIANVVAAVRATRLPGRWYTAGLMVALGVGGELMFVLAARSAPAAVMAALGLLLAVEFAILAAVVAGRPGVVAPLIAIAAIVGGVPALLVAGEQSQTLAIVVDAALVVGIVVAFVLLRRDTARADAVIGRVRAALTSPESIQVAAGVMFGLAVTARLTVLFGALFFVFVGAGGSWLRRGLLAGAGAAVPVVTLLVVTYATSGQLFNPAYDYLYQRELVAYGSVLNYNADFSISDLRYIPQNLLIMLFSLPDFFPQHLRQYSIYPVWSDALACADGASRALWNAKCAIAEPQATGMSILLASPAYLLAAVAFVPVKLRQLDRATVGATLAVLGIAIVNLMHFSQGWVQFGYRFSNDFVPFALILVAIGASRLGRLRPVVLLVAASIVINFWGTMWAVTLGW